MCGVMAAGKGADKMIKKAITVSFMLLLLCFLASCGSVSDGKETPAKGEGAIMLPVDPLLTNLLDGKSYRFMKLSLCLEISGPVQAEKTKARMAVVRDTVVTVVSFKSFRDILSPEGKVQLKDELMMRFNQLLGERVVQDLYITDIIMQ